MSNRHITKEQFSQGTTIDGDRLEKAYSDVQDHYNNLPLRSMANLVQNQINWCTFQPVMVQTNFEVNGPNTGYQYLLRQHPWKRYRSDGLRNPDTYLDAGNFPLQNIETYKGVGTNADLNPEIASESYVQAWEQTFRTSKPTIIKELSYLVMADAGFVYTLGGNGSFWGQYADGVIASDGSAYYPNLFADASGEIPSNISYGFQVLICVDNNLNLDNTDRMSKEAHIYKVRASSFATDSLFRPVHGDGSFNDTKWATPDICGEQFLEAYPQTEIVPGSFEQQVQCVPFGLQINLRDIMLPVPAGSKIRIVFVMPEGLYDTFNYQAGGDTTEITNLSGLTGNMWNCGVTLLEELEAK